MTSCIKINLAFTHPPLSESHATSLFQWHLFSSSEFLKFFLNLINSTVIFNLLESKFLLYVLEPSTYLTMSASWDRAVLYLKLFARITPSRASSLKVYPCTALFPCQRSSWLARFQVTYVQKVGTFFSWCYSSCWIPVRVFVYVCNREQPYYLFVRISSIKDPVRNVQRQLEKFGSRSSTCLVRWHYYVTHAYPVPTDTSSLSCAPPIFSLSAYALTNPSLSTSVDPFRGHLIFPTSLPDYRLLSCTRSAGLPNGSSSSSPSASVSSDDCPRVKRRVHTSGLTAKQLIGHIQYLRRV